eukprot:3376814-Prymnesium_polylepis.1
MGIWRLAPAHGHAACVKPGKSSSILRPPLPDRCTACGGEGRGTRGAAQRRQGICGRPVGGVTAAAGVARSPHHFGGRDHPAGAQQVEAPPLDGVAPLGEHVAAG